MTPFRAESRICATRALAISCRSEASAARASPACARSTFALARTLSRAPARNAGSSSSSSVLQHARAFAPPLRGSRAFAPWLPPAPKGAGRSAPDAVRRRCDARALPPAPRGRAFARRAPRFPSRRRRAAPHARAALLRPPYRLRRARKRFLTQIVEPVLFGETTRGGGRRFGGLGEAVPAPQIAFLGDEPLAGLQAARAGSRPRRAARRRSARDVARNAGGASHERSKRRTTFGGSEGSPSLGRERPMRRRGGFGRGVEIVAERRAKRGLIALRDGDALDDRRPEAAGARLQQLFERADFGFEPLRARARRPPTARARRSRPRAPAAMGVFGLMRGVVRRARVLRRQFEGFLEPRDFFGAAALLRRSARIRSRCGSAPPRSARRGAAPRRSADFERGALGVDARRAAPARATSSASVCASASSISFEPRARLASRVLLASASAPASSSRSSSSRCVTSAASSISAPFALEIAGELLDVAREFGDPLLGALLFRLERLARDDEPMQRRAGLGLLVAQRRQLMRGDRLQLRGFRLLQRALRDVRAVRLRVFPRPASAARLRDDAR